MHRYLDMRKSMLTQSVMAHSPKQTAGSNWQALGAVCLTAGAYLGLLLQLKRLLQPGCGPGVAALPGIEHNARPDVVYGTPVAALRWKHPFFEDIRKSSFPEYGHVQPSKYAEKVCLSCKLVKLSSPPSLVW